MSGAAPLVSVLVRSMDRPTLQRALDSIAAQQHARIEVVVVAACGPAHRALPSHCGAFPLRLVQPDHPLPRAQAANAALDAAQGDWLNLLDDDDEWLPVHVNALLAHAQANPDARLVHSISEDVADDGRVLRLHGAPFKPWRQLDTGFFRSQCALLARSLLADGVRFDAQFDVLEDMDFFIQCAQRTRFAFLDRVTARYHLEAGESGAGGGANRDEARIAAAITRLRAKWATLEATLRAAPEFRVEHALWLLQQGQADSAQRIAADLLAQHAETVDALALACVVCVARGDVAAAERYRARIGAHTPHDGALAQLYAHCAVQLASLPG